MRYVSCLRSPWGDFLFIWNWWYEQYRIPKNNILFFKGLHLKRNPPQGDLRQEACRKHPVLKTTAKIYTYTPIIWNTVYIILIRHCKHLLVVVYKSLSRMKALLRHGEIHGARDGQALDVHREGRVSYNIVCLIFHYRSFFDFLHLNISKSR